MRQSTKASSESSGSLGRGSLKVSMGSCFFGTDIGIDPMSIDDLRRTLQGERGLVAEPSRVMNENVSSLDELLQKMSLMDYVVTCRFHGIVFAHIMNKPVLAISHHPKMATLMHDIGLGKYCVDIRTFELGLLVETFAAVVRDADEIKEQMAGILMCYREQLKGQFDDLFPPRRLPEDGFVGWRGTARTCVEALCGARDARGHSLRELGRKCQQDEDG